MKIFTSIFSYISEGLNDFMIKYNIDDKKIINNIKNKSKEIIINSKEELKQLKKFANEEVELIKKYIK